MIKPQQDNSHCTNRPWVQQGDTKIFVEESKGDGELCLPEENTEEM